mmetsp:Transcript_15824/g.37283  ORF Transcript_15824/g.37283 Transcript_15824/m.37283 type:complete len:98 (-) Transcript_15824:1153-1446(-)
MRGSSSPYANGRIIFFDFVRFLTPAWALDPEGTTGDALGSRQLRLTLLGPSDCPEAGNDFDLFTYPAGPGSAVPRRAWFSNWVVDPTDVGNVHAAWA